MVQYVKHAVPQQCSVWQRPPRQEPVICMAGRPLLVSGFQAGLRRSSDHMPGQSISRRTVVDAPSRSPAGQMQNVRIAVWRRYTRFRGYRPSVVTIDGHMTAVRTPKRLPALRRHTRQCRNARSPNVLDALVDSFGKVVVGISAETREYPIRNWQLDKVRRGPHSEG